MRKVPKLVLIVLLLFVLFVGLPLAMGSMSMAPCPSCTGVEGPAATAMCVAVMSLFLLVVSFSASRMPSGSLLMRTRLLTDPPERPPQIA